MYEPIGIRFDRLARVEKLDRGLTSPANNHVFIPAYANDFVEESSPSVQPGSIHLDVSTETHFTSHILLAISASLSFSRLASPAAVHVRGNNASNARVIVSNRLADGSAKSKARTRRKSRWTSEIDRRASELEESKFFIIRFLCHVTDNYILLYKC